MAVHVDLDAKRKERESEEAPTVTLGGETFQLPRELPVGVFMQLKEMDKNPEKGMDAFDLILDSMLGDQKEAFLAQGPSMNDVMDLFSGLVSSYEAEEGEASAS